MWTDMCAQGWDGVGKESTSTMSTSTPSTHQHDGAQLTHKAVLFCGGEEGRKLVDQLATGSFVGLGTNVTAGMSLVELVELLEEPRAVALGRGFRRTSPSLRRHVDPGDDTHRGKHRPNQAGRPWCRQITK